MALDRAAAILKLAAPIAEAVPILGTPVKSAFEATVQILEYAGKVKNNKEKMRELAEHAANLFKGLKDRLDEMKTPSYSTDLERLRAQVEAILSLLTEIKVWAQQQTEQSKLHRAWHKEKDLADIAKWRRRLDDVYQQFMMESQISLDRKLTMVVSATESEILMRLAPVFAAHYDALAAPSGCLDGTRVEVIETILAWCSQPRTSLHIYWLAGHAGTGKSAIAKTLSEQLVSMKDTLVVTFFASKNSEDRRDPIRMLHTIVHQLAFDNASIRSHVIKVLNSQPKIVDQPLNKRIKSFLLEPLQELVRTHSVVIVIDALDECLSIQGVEGGSLIHDLASVLGSLPLKLVVTSRKEPSLQQMFSEIPTAKQVELHEIEGAQVTSDVRSILVNGFEKIAKKRKISTSPWPSQQDLDELIKRTDRLIIFAATVLKFVENDRFSAHRQLSQVLAQGSATSVREQYRLVDELYLNVLITAARPSADEMEPDSQLCARIRALTGIVVVLYNPMSIAALAQLIEMDEDDVSRDVDALSAVLLVGSDAADGSGPPVVRIFHPSFRDFLLERCKDARFSVDASKQHHIVSVFCLRVLNQSLKYDICDIKDPTVPHSEVTNPALPTRLRNRVPGAAHYACRFWINHIAVSGSPDPRLCSILQTFLSQHTFHWIELVSLTENLRNVMRHLVDAKWSQRFAIQPWEFDPYVILNDTLQMLQICWRIVETYALQVYYSGPIGMPQCTLLKCSDDKEEMIAHAPKLVSPRAAGRTVDMLVLEGHTGLVFSVAFSPDGKQIASGSYDKTVRVWDAQSGHEISKLTGHTDIVWSVAFSPDGKQIASGSDDQTVRVWDVQSGYEITKFEDHTDRVMSVAFSPDGKQIASGSYGETVRVWDAQSSHEITKFKGHTGWQVNSVAFSPDGKFVVAHMYNGLLQFLSIADADSDTKLGGKLSRTTDIANGNVASPLVLLFDTTTGWIMGKSPTSSVDDLKRNLCWLPLELRGHTFATYNNKMISIVSDSTHQLTIIDMGPMLDMLHDLAVQ